ncbi:MAG: haloacid dehalogenase-like hydrolase, partial [Bacteroidales bacterium]|nr:haloacid dehalogenase-like hydrolase [Bacteroidales bacterium]
QEHNFIPDLNMDIHEFWKEANEIAKQHDMDEVLAYMFLMVEKAKQKNISIEKEDFFQYGKQITFYQGVESYFERINRYAAEKGFEIEHYIISSGLREFVEGTSIAKHFKDIFASGFMYDAKGVACWPSLGVNYTNKTQFLFRINKGIHNSYDNTLINKIVPENDKPIPFSNMIYLGDGETDIPAMKMVKMQGGFTIAVYNENFIPSENRKKAPREICEEIVLQQRAHFMAPANYLENSSLDILIKRCIDKIVAEQELNKLN